MRSPAGRLRLSEEEFSNYNLNELVRKIFVQTLITATESILDNGYSSLRKHLTLEERINDPSDDYKDRKQLYQTALALLKKESYTENDKKIIAALEENNFPEGHDKINSEVIGVLKRYLIEPALNGISNLPPSLQFSIENDRSALLNRAVLYLQTGDFAAAYKDLMRTVYSISVDDSKSQKMLLIVATKLYIREIEKSAENQTTNPEQLLQTCQDMLSKLDPAEKSELLEILQETLVNASEKGLDTRSLLNVFNLFQQEQKTSQMSVRYQRKKQRVPFFPPPWKRTHTLFKLYIRNRNFITHYIKISLRHNQTVLKTLRRSAS